MSRRTTNPKLRRGFTLAEALVVSGLMALLAYLLGQTWSGLGRPTADLAAQGRVAHEARLAVVALSRDLGGSLDSDAARAGPKMLGKFAGRMQPNGTELWLCFDGGSAPNGVPDWAPPDTVIVYQLQAGRLVRWDQSTNTTFTVARCVDSLAVQDLGDRVRISLTFSYRGVI
jgi:type II secretory pathway component PulJ